MPRCFFTDKRIVVTVATTVSATMEIEGLSGRVWRSSPAWETERQASKTSSLVSDLTRLPCVVPPESITKQTIFKHHLVVVLSASVPCWFPGLEYSYTKSRFP